MALERKMPAVDLDCSHICDDALEGQIYYRGEKKHTHKTFPCNFYKCWHSFAGLEDWTITGQVWDSLHLMKIAWVDVTSGGACTKYLVNVASSKDVAVAGNGGVFQSVLKMWIDSFLYYVLQAESQNCGFVYENTFDNSTELILLREPLCVASRYKILLKAYLN